MAELTVEAAEEYERERGRGEDALKLNSFD